MYVNSEPIFSGCGFMRILIMSEAIVSLSPCARPMYYLVYTHVMSFLHSLQDFASYFSSLCSLTNCVFVPSVIQLIFFFIWSNYSIILCQESENNLRSGLFLKEISVRNLPANTGSNQLLIYDLIMREIHPPFTFLMI